MYNVSNAYRAKILSNGVRVRRITGTLGSIPFTTEDILANSLKFTNQMAKGADISLGGVFAGEISLTFLRTFSDQIERGTWRGKILRISIGLKIDEDTWEDIPLGVFEIDNADHSSTGVDITAYDYMPRFDKNLSINETAGYPYDLLNYCCRMCNVRMGLSREEIEELPNGTEYLGIYPDNDMSTFRDLISWVSCTLGGYATMNRAGELEVRTFASNTDITLNKVQRASGGKWSDFRTSYTGLSVVDIENDTVRYYGASVDNGLTMKLGSNPLMQYGSDATKTRMANAILNALSNFNYTPFSCSSFVDPAIDLGDIIDYTEGLAGTLSRGMVMKFTYTFNKGIKLEGFGKNPALFGAQSKTDKNIAGLVNRGSEADRISIISFANVIAIGIDDEWREVARLRIGVMNSQIVMMHGVIRLNLSEAGTVYVRFRLNGEYLPFIHVLQFPVGLDTITLFLPLSISNELVNDFRVEIQSPDGVGIIAVDNAKIALQGVGVTTGNWDGYIEIEDEYSFPFQRGLGFNYEDEAEVVTSSSILPITARDTAAFPLQAGLVFGYTETNNTRITMEGRVFRITTEDGRRLATEDGQNIITEE